MILIGAFAAVVILASAGHLGWFAWVLGAGAAGLYYWHDVRRHPVVACRACKGDGGHGSKIGGAGWFRRPFGDCWCCGGRKAHPRLALRLIDSGKYRQIRNDISQARGRITR